MFNVVGLGYADMYNLKIHNRWGELLFESNKKGELSNSLIKYANLKSVKKHKFEIKKNTKQYTKYRHFQKLNDILKKDIV